jgi:hypothetical protein
MKVNDDIAKTDQQAGQGFALGATVDWGGANFSVISKNATAIELLLPLGETRLTSYVGS